MSPPVAFVIGAGPGVGLTVARHLAAQGYKLAIGSRNPDTEGAKKEGFFPVKLDIAKHETISKGFTDLEAHYGTPASVVIYNGAYLCAASLCRLTRWPSPPAASHAPPPKTADPFGLPFDAFESIADGGVGVYAAVQGAVAGFRKVAGHPRVFIVTGNLLPFVPARADYFALGVQKRVAAALVEQGAASYAADGFR
jgi:NAD(P)-dependent dehydrogenase (short-subunit alcohol dehydrogenase family)